MPSFVQGSGHIMMFIIGMASDFKEFIMSPGGDGFIFLNHRNKYLSFIKESYAFF